MLANIIEKAETKAGSQRLLSQKFKIDYRRLCDYKAGRRTPDDSLIGELAEYVGLNPIETILQCKLETDKEKATLWQAWLSKIVVRSAGLEPTPQASEAYRHIPAGIFIILIIKYIYKSITYNNNARGHFIKCYLTPKIPIYQIRR